MKAPDKFTSGLPGMKGLRAAHPIEARTRTGANSHHVISLVSSQLQCCHQEFLPPSPHGPTVASSVAGRRRPSFNRTPTFSTPPPNSPSIPSNHADTPRCSPPASLHVEWSFARIVDLASARCPATSNVKTTAPRPCSSCEPSTFLSSDTCHLTTMERDLPAWRRMRGQKFWVSFSSLRYLGLHRDFLPSVMMSKANGVIGKDASTTLGCSDLPGN
ncbi:hypothetical protein IWZ03DRAFT_181200 [Phyllosticta citriasiana]|uniref:Uncharacterized protein n=1 Tax=Phyllosticta citriasiana TaxID=595635 RepID=A0ABR1KN85_9PEZI